jgi:hypothetical protein
MAVEPTTIGQVRAASSLSHVEDLACLRAAGLCDLTTIPIAVWSSEDWLSKHGTDAPTNPEQADGEAAPAAAEAEEEDEVEQ